MRIRIQIWIQNFWSMRIRTQIQGFHDKNFKKIYSRENKFRFFGYKIAIYLSLGLHKGRPSHRRSRQLSKSSTSKLDTSSLFIFFGSFLFYLYLYYPWKHLTPQYKYRTCDFPPLVLFLVLLARAGEKALLPLGPEHKQQKNLYSGSVTFWYGSGSGDPCLLPMQGCGSGSAWIRNNLSCWIRIRIQIADPDPDPDPDPGGQKWPTKIENRKKYRIFMFWSAGCSLFRAEGFSCSLGVLYGGLGISKLLFLIEKIKI